MKRVALTILLMQFFSLADSQNRFSNPDSLKTVLDTTSQDTTKVLLFADLSFTYAFLQLDTSIFYAQKAISLARQLKYKKGEAAGMDSYGWALWASGNYDKAIEAALKSLNLYKELRDYDKMVSAYTALAVYYRDADDSGEALKYGILSKNLFESPFVTRNFVGIEPYTTIGSIYLFNNQIDSAAWYISKSYEREKATRKNPYGYTMNMMGLIETKKKHYQRALDYYRALIPKAMEVKNYLDVVDAYTSIATVYRETGNIDSSIWYAKEILRKPTFSIFTQGVLFALTTLAQDYRIKNNNDSALKYLELRVALNDSLFDKSKSRAIQTLTFNEKIQEQEIEDAAARYQNKVRLYGLLSLSGLFLLIGIILYRNNKVKQKANTLLQQQKEKIENTLKVLESTQAQLIQSEKMASLGELTAGIAHEIQNPLNFINNFSEVNRELIDEMELEIEKGNSENLRSLAADVKNNEEKIGHHGKRADDIVKGMLLHSRKSTGQKELTDINALADEYLRLAYHGLRAKNKSFNVNLQTDFDLGISKINIVTQDVGRVLLNLYNNAMYSVMEKKQQQPVTYEPVVSVMTKKAGNNVFVYVRDNGLGIPQKIVDKIFQPFFTTKPTGFGTGLGLSISYDIIKAQGGQITVETKEGEFAEFVIQIPVV
jgi:two-component system NtrC family sensor kinase